ncbi:NAD(P)-binding protein [Exidia glandulosa HHB12029]|uniref:NAD(P)-binding protein n=1 Tax=Exidia glandulosa HHB12029 TaxID=1314781 RepID=A0A165DUH3_EXIGL|nr:NAD(P)-binding protein [Exidia glandulosa HHB12029]
MPAWLITGSSRGIGFELTKQLATVPNGIHTIFATCRNPATATSLSELAKNYKNIHVVALDVDDDATVQAAAETVTGLLGGKGIDYLVNNAAWSQADGLDTANPDTMTAMYNTHVAGSFRVYRAFLPLVRLSERKAIINVSSELGSLGSMDDPRFVELFPGAVFPTYSCAKAGLNMLTRKIAKGHPDFIVFAFAPGWLKTDMGGPNAMDDVEPAVERHIKLYESATIEKFSGKFINQWGQEVAW